MKLCEGQDMFYRLCIGIGALVIGGILFYLAQSFPVKARMWPNFVYVVFFFLPGAALIMQSIKGRALLKHWWENKVPSTKDEKKKTVQGFVIFSMLLICTLLIHFIGFVEVCFLFCLVVTMYMDPKRVKGNLLITVLVTAMILAMKYGFSFVLPSGPLGI
jgi:TRAP-type mannitol/chloroaromatic compound transport system permease small subunit